MYDYFEENGTAYIVMEYLDGIKLNEFVKKSKPFSVDKIVSLMIPLLNSLNDLHDKNIIHRDISPDNITLMPDGSLTLYDFGAAYEFSNQNQKSHFVAVKHGYAPPEQYGGKSEQGTWTDVYAICATIYYCITGQVPASSAERLNEDILSPPSAFGIHIEPYIEKALLKGMSVDRKNRYQTVEKLAIALCNPPGVIVIPPEIRVDPPETEKKKSASIAAICIGAVALIAFIIFAVSFFDFFDAMPTISDSSEEASVVTEAERQKPIEIRNLSSDELKNIEAAIKLSINGDSAAFSDFDKGTLASVKSIHICGTDFISAGSRSNVGTEFPSEIIFDSSDSYTVDGNKYNPGGIKSLDFLKCFPNLNEVTVMYNRVSDISALSGMENLVDVDLSYNDISDIDALSGKKLKNIYLSANRIGSLAPLTGSKELDRLDISDNNIGSIDEIQNCTGLTYLSLSGNSVESIGSITNMTKLEVLDISGNDITDISPLGKLTGLLSLDISENDISDISAVSVFSSLQILDISHNERLKKIDAVSGLSGLNQLDFSFCNISALPDMSALKNLIMLNASYNSFENVKPISALSSLKWLDISNNAVKTCSVLSSLSELEYINIKDNKGCQADASVLKGKNNKLIIEC